MGNGGLARVRRWDLRHRGSAMTILEFLTAWIGARRIGLGSAQDRGYSYDSLDVDDCNGNQLEGIIWTTLH